MTVKKTVPLLRQGLALRSFNCGPRMATMYQRAPVAADQAGEADIVRIHGIVDPLFNDDDDARQSVELHEAIHLMDSVYGIKLKERQVDALASAFLEFLRTAEYT